LEKKIALPSVIRNDKKSVETIMEFMYHRQCRNSFEFVATKGGRTKGENIVQIWGDNRQGDLCVLNFVFDAFRAQRGKIINFA
jgi:hypothetical protein